MSAGAAPAARRLPVGRILTGLLLLAAVLLIGRLVGRHLPGFAARVEGLGAWGPLAFIAGYAAATVAFAPGSILTLAAGALFGLGRGVCYALAGATLGASGAFLLARYLARSAVERRFLGNARFAAIDRAIAGQGRKIVLLLRLSPVFPFNLLNYALGLTRVRFADYLLASAGMIPGTLLYVYYGVLLGDVAALAGGAAVRRDAAYYVVLALGLAATAAVTAVVTRSARRA
ncbi:MAG: TVP38/TMEM64 family protein, partial [bacterium]